jgi:predicted nucleotidyltransferase
MVSESGSAQLDSIGQQAAEILIQLAHPRRLWLFGSRARNQATPGADYDFALEHPSLTPAERWKITEALDRLPTLKQFDVGLPNPFVKRFRKKAYASMKDKRQVLLDAWTQALERLAEVLCRNSEDRVVVDALFCGSSSALSSAGRL